MTKLENSRVVRFGETKIKIPGPPDLHYVNAIQRRTLKVLLSCPAPPNRQTPHDQDEIYVIARGHGVLFHDGQRDTFEPGDLIFIAAGTEHWFEDFSEDLAVWVVFFGPMGGEIPVTQENNQTEKLFSYGTLQRDSVQLDTFGRLLTGNADALIGYRIAMIPITNQTVIEATGDTHYRNLEFTGNENDQVEGTAFAVTIPELEKSDEYEKDANYKRVQVRLRSGISSWVYLHHSAD